MVQMGYSSDEEDAVFEPVKQKYTLRKPVTPYICSTPCDFEEERTFLTEKIVPQLEDLCHQRGTRFNPYDIQWKPDSFQTESGHLLRVNLDFIVKCSPYFLCLLGETYGPHRIPDIGKLPESLHAMTEDTPWLDRNYLTAAAAGYKWIMKEVHQNCSIPELEIIQAVFLGASEEEKARLTSIHKPDSEYADLNIRDLKQRIVNKGLPVKYFRTCAELGNHVLADWREIIDELYPPLLDGPSLLECSSVSNLELVSQNFKELCGSFQASLTLGPCVLLLDGVDELGATLDLSPQQIKSFSWIPLPLPPQCRIVITTLVSDLSCTNLRKRPDASFLTLSNLNTTKVKAELLEDHMQMHYEHLKRFQLQTLFESKMSGRPLFLTILGNEMCSHGVYTELDAYTETIREMCTSIRDLYVRCFKRWSRDHSWTYEVLSAEQTESEEADYIGWVPDVLRLLAVSRSGLTANEILDVLVAMGYQENVKVTQFDWLVFLKCIGENITESPYGVFNFAHQHMREVVEYVLLRTVKPSTAELITLSDVDQVWKKQKQEFHGHLAQYFRTLPHSQRRAEELPWQLLMAGDFEGLKEELTNPEMFEKLFDAEGKNPSNHYDLSRNWFYLEKAGHIAADAYKHLLTQIGLLDKQLDDIEVESIGYASSSTSGDEFMASPTPESHDRLTPPQIMLKMTGVMQEVLRTLSSSPKTSLSQFMFELGHKQTGEAILMALNARMMK
ncbi:TTC41-like protein, partial [Mya arenaria]